MDRSRIQLVTTASLPYLLSIPPASESLSASLVPVLFFLHGYDEAAPAPIEQALMRHGPLRPGNPPTALADFIVIAPQLPVAGDLWHRYADPVQNILDQVLTAWRGDAERAYLSGFSFGGNGVFDIALKQPDVWAALWAVDPTRAPVQDPETPVWLSAGEVTRRRKAGFQDRLRLVSFEAEARGERVYEDEGLPHVATAASAYGKELIYSWLLRHRRGAPSAGRARLQP